ncbi:hypothetical protein K32_24160 [Kaistia sp. 32K]|uniref:hypothetical protein n=1 Tax=Kaistia sp. 32K TaxID=2795690 RepID=UPI001915FFF4|nr:hypothetical protein [Kaistia sp. 32K]BCP53799.1 hypothetical protein K32_24160 [Kaistia sp. 32K]
MLIMLRWLQIVLAWRVVLDTGVHVYETNSITGHRRVRRYAVGVYQPVDLGWIETGFFTLAPPPPSGGSAGRR